MHVLINIDVGDLERATTFYCSTFDLTSGRRFGTFGVELLGARAPIFLLCKALGTPVAVSTDQKRSYERHWSPVHLDFVVDEIEAAVATALSNGAKIESPVATHSWGKLAVMADPFGHGFCFVQFLGRGYDELAT